MNKHILVRYDMTFTCRDLRRFMRSWIQQTSDFHMPHSHASIFIFGFHKHPSFLETVISEISMRFSQHCDSRYVITCQKNDISFHVDIFRRNYFF